MKIVLDASAIIQSSRDLKSTEFLRLFEIKDRLGITLIFPRVAVEEVINHFREDLEKQRIKISEDVTRYMKLVKGNLPEHVSSARIERDVAQFRESLEAKIAEIGGVVTGYPSVTHRDVVARDVSRRKPFGGSKSGYRDALIWLGIVEQLRSPEESLVFVSNNTKDFALDGGSGVWQLHPDLVDDLIQKKVNPNRVSFVRTLVELIETVVNPKMEWLDSIVESFKHDEDGALTRSLIKVLDDTMDKIVAKEGLEFFGLRPEALLVRYAGNHGDVRTNEWYVKYLDGKTLQIEVNVQFNADFEVDIDVSDLSEFHEIDDEGSQDLAVFVEPKPVVGRLMVACDLRTRLVRNSQIRGLTIDHVMAGSPMGMIFVPQQDLLLAS